MRSLTRSNSAMANLTEVPPADTLERCSEVASEQSPELPEHVRAELGSKLRKLYGDVEAEPMPAGHVELLLRLRWLERERRRLAAADGGPTSPTR